MRIIPYFLQFSFDWQMFIKFTNRILLSFLMFFRIQFIKKPPLECGIDCRSEDEGNTRLSAHAVPLRLLCRTLNMRSKTAQCPYRGLAFAANAGKLLILKHVSPASRQKLCGEQQTPCTVSHHTDGSLMPRSACISASKPVALLT